jgi:hypothetical protein
MSLKSILKKARDKSKTQGHKTRVDGEYSRKFVKL